ncbi:PC4 and SFRS1-interacting protein CLL-associated antigen KW-7 [Triplophysa tibetana]|uniref:PC4 and SFRS1-interacting protein CLL-associated antigen KW-7 n=1 Tax=Triplophysa tibetana TaxID=1572043 RepID=A0A5A9NAS7_9TELE|nr:PC4 and SFRS1-interacting protein CLL-associated antigen KW-7 [Triplophysa tibetana]
MEVTGDFMFGDIVFAKMKGYPFWPARVGEGKAPKSKIPIFFYGTHTTTFLFPKDIVPYWPNKEKYGRPIKRGGFEEGMWEIENDPGVCLRGQKKAALAKRLLDCRPNSKAKMKKVENKSDHKVQTVSAKDLASENESKSVTPNKSEIPVKNNKSTDSKTPTGHKTSHLRVWAKTCPPASTPQELKCITSERRTLSSKRIMLTRPAVVGTVLSARRTHKLKIVSLVKKHTDADNQNKSSRVTRSRSDVKDTEPDTSYRSVKASSLKRKRPEIESDEKRETGVSSPSSPAGELQSLIQTDLTTSESQDSKQHEAEDTHAPEESENNEVKKKEPEKKHKDVKSDILSIFEKQEIKEQKTHKDEEKSKIPAEKRQSVLRSLQGLVTSTRGKTQTSRIKATQHEDVQKRAERSRGVRDENRGPLTPAEERREDTEQNTPSEEKRTEPQNISSREDDSKAPSLSVIDSLLYRLHGDIRISMTLDNPDVSRCLLALEELSQVPVSSRNMQNHSELIDTLRKMRWFRGSEAIMFKASMLYHRFKNIYLIGDTEDTLSQEYIHSLQEERERAKRQDDDISEMGISEETTNTEQTSQTTVPHSASDEDRS